MGKKQSVRPFEGDQDALIAWPTSMTAVFTYLFSAYPLLNLHAFRQRGVKGSDEKINRHLKLT